MFRLLKQNGTQVNNNNNIFERRTSLGEVSKGDTLENLDIKQTSCQDGLSQGLFTLTKKMIFNDYKIWPYVLVCFTQRFKRCKSFPALGKKKGLIKIVTYHFALVLSKINL